MDIITQMKPQEVLMPATGEFTVDQIVELFSRLPDSERQAALSIIRQKERERRLARAIQQVADDARHLARERGLDWDALSQPEREELGGKFAPGMLAGCWTNSTRPATAKN